MAFTDGRISNLVSEAEGRLHERVANPTVELCKSSNRGAADSIDRLCEQLATESCLNIRLMEAAENQHEQKILAISSYLEDSLCFADRLEEAVGGS